MADEVTRRRMGIVVLGDMLDILRILWRCKQRVHTAEETSEKSTGQEGSSSPTRCAVTP